MAMALMFGSDAQKDFFKADQRSAAVDVGTSVISEFYTPLVKRRHFFENKRSRADSPRRRRAK